MSVSVCVLLPAPHEAQFSAKKHSDFIAGELHAFTTTGVYVETVAKRHRLLQNSR